MNASLICDFQTNEIESLRLTCMREMLTVYAFLVEVEERRFACCRLWVGQCYLNFVYCMESEEFHWISYGLTVDAADFGR